MIYIMYMLYFEIIVRVMSCRLRLDAGYAAEYM